MVCLIVAGPGRNVTYLGGMTMGGGKQNHTEKKTLSQEQITSFEEEGMCFEGSRGRWYSRLEYDYFVEGWCNMAPSQP